MRSAACPAEATNAPRRAGNLRPAAISLGRTLGDGAREDGAERAEARGEALDGERPAALERVRELAAFVDEPLHDDRAEKADRREHADIEGEHGEERGEPTAAVQATAQPLEEPDGERRHRSGEQDRGEHRTRGEEREIQEG